MDHLSILLIDDEATQLESLQRFLNRRDYEVYTARSGPAGYDLALKHPINIVLTDYRMPDWNGYEVLRKMQELNPNIDVVVLTAFGTIDDAVEIMKSGAYDYLTKPIDLDELESVLERIAEKQQLVRENQQLREQLKQRFKFDAIISQSGAMEEVLNTAARVAPSKATVLVRGESGTGKELVAKAIHYAGERKETPFIPVNVAALPENLLESELFGHEKGAYTGATGRRIGRFEEADGGTLFIDEVGEIPLAVQAKLLRAIQFGQIQRLGDNEIIDVDVRIIGATHRNLEEMVKSGDFREDLYYRLNVISVQIPPLRKRKSDIPVLVNHFIEKYADENQKNVEGISSDALDFLMKYEFPGNVRELENMVESAVVMTRNKYINKSDLPKLVKVTDEETVTDPRNLEGGYEKKVQAFEKTMIREALEQADGNQSAAARLLGISERHIRSRMERLGLK